MDNTVIIVTTSFLAGLLVGAYSTRIHEVKNKKGKWNENFTYFRCINPFNVSPFLFTASDLKNPSERARRNKEDL